MSTQTWKIPDGFILGAAASAWQTEGWDGKRPSQDSYLDMWYKNAAHIWHNGNGPAVATDFYNRYKEDIGYMKEIGLTHYRTSINWSRFLIDYETAEVDEVYAGYIDNVINELIASGVEPMICLEHYEIPAALMEKYGGWGSKHVVDLYTAYTEKVLQRYGDRVKYWFTFNEPIVPQTRIYLDAIRYPYEQNTKKWMQWNFNKALATAKAVQLFRAGKAWLREDAKIGVILNPEVTYARSSAQHDQKAAHIYDLFFNRVFLDPCIKGGYPEELMELLVRHEIVFDHDEDELDLIKQHTVDFAGINLYYPCRVKAPSRQWNDSTPFHPAYYYEHFELPGRKMNPFRGWEIYPRIVYDMAMRMKNEYGNIEWLIAENGMGVEDEKRFKNEDGIIQDDYRIEFISSHLAEAVKGITDGSNCKGYMLWAFTDNVSPMNAFKNRYGLVEIHLEQNRRRALKKSAHFYRQIIQNRQFETELDRLYK
ncbi:glycoside hydrolase family 1 protein [Bacillus swezeyi]|uniref:6-phospho-beta-glucosidase n=1 Tax=Bacillus swezeyi TaxID=1925020 RepID=A0A1R1QR89_9BACI|nr:glycoside hydrolase family 1 protein [Bacillus swezeyi]MEC1259046.1 glycoside hydrolase family 1 protein [Bacillus swezeyi]MED2927993.1 glycoside hydrolase family 1 protein [Bacillus swezeyi]MED2942253.1 glycoside hydrolase family 1 protein [Bacillus swezeyi]MED2965095.1 glycoside hydrolase family 1 protein [Bacillus swezeyi]MED2977800.1 glycoside hydrolase family 1 protein [Bacillus swezeyi]